MENQDIPKDYSGIISLYMGFDGLHIETGRIQYSPLGSILYFIVKDGLIEAKFVEKFDEEGHLIYSYYYN